MRVVVLLFLLLLCSLSGRILFARSRPEPSIRALADTVGFAHRAWQMDSVMVRIKRLDHGDLVGTQQPSGTVWRAVICPHDDYAYTGWLYPAVLNNIKARTIIIFGVAHKASVFNLENRLVFDSFSSWQGPYGRVTVSPLRDEIVRCLSKDMAVVDNAAQSAEHSVEALIPFLQYSNRDIEIISILVPRMDYERMQLVSRHLARELFAIMQKKELRMGEDVVLLVSSDSVHYGDEAWSGNNFAFYGTGGKANALAEAHDRQIIRSCFKSELTEEKVARFYSLTTSPDNAGEYKWTWCGRFSIPFGLLTALNLQALEKSAPLTGIPVAYATSISQPHLKVDDLGMGQTAVATVRHWVGYAAIGFK